MVAYYTEKFLNKIVPGIFKSIFVGLGTIFVAGSLGFLILGLLGNYLGQGNDKYLKIIKNINHIGFL